MMKKKYTLLFDVDGVLLDTMPIWENAANLYLKEVYGIDAPPELDQHCATLSLIEAGEYILGLYPEILLTPRQIADDVASYIRKKYVKAPERAGVVDTIHKLKYLGYRMYLATASEEKNVEGALSHLGIWDCFEDIFTCTAMGYSKSYTEYFEEVARRIGLPCDKLIMIEDSLHSMQTAKSAGLLVVGVYEESSKALSVQIEQVADIYLHEISDIIPWLSDSDLP